MFLFITYPLSFTLHNKYKMRINQIQVTNGLQKFTFLWQFLTKNYIIEIIKKGTGAIPTENDQVKVHYHGTLLDGTVFDSSVDRNEPAVFGATQVIPGWTEALKLMPVGSKWKVYVPYNLAYGADDRGTIKPFSTLIFDVELLAIEK